MDYQFRHILTWLIMTIFVSGVISIYCYIYNHPEQIRRRVVPEAEEVPVAVEVPEEYKRLIV